jgi:hypothetical protein
MFYAETLDRKMVGLKTEVCARLFVLGILSSVASGQVRAA